MTESLFEVDPICRKCGGSAAEPRRVWSDKVGANVACPDKFHRVSGAPLPVPDLPRIGAFHGPGSGAPDTERAAAILAYPRTGTARRKVLDHIRSCGAHGATDEEVSTALRMRLYTAAPRRNELARDGWIVDSGRRRPTTTGTQAVVWVLSEQGRREWRPGEGDGNRF